MTDVWHHDAYVSLLSDGYFHLFFYIILLFIEMGKVSPGPAIKSFVSPGTGPKKAGPANVYLFIKNVRSFCSLVTPLHSSAGSSSGRRHPMHH